MKKILIRLVGSLCILASLGVMFLTTTIQLEDVKRKDLRTVREQLTEDLDLIEETLQDAVEYDEDFKDDLQENGLPSTKSKIKNRFKDAENLIDTLFDTEISLNELIFLSLEIPKYVEDTENLMDTDYCAELIFETSEYSYQEDIQDSVDEISGITSLFSLLAGVLIFIVVLGAAAVITHMLNKVRFIKYIFLVFLAALVAVVAIGVPSLANAIQDFDLLPSAAEDLTLTSTIWPYIAIILAIVPVILDIIFERKQKQKLEV